MDRAEPGGILAALYTILMGNPRRRPGNHPPAETRFKTWWDMVGSAVENAADEHARNQKGITPPTFRTLFLDGETDDEQTSSLADVLTVLNGGLIAKTTTGVFTAGDVSNYAGRADPGAIAFLAALELACGTPIKIISSTTINWKLKAIADAPVMVGDKLLSLQHVKADRGGHRAAGFEVRSLS